MAPAGGRGRRGDATLSGEIDEGNGLTGGDGGINRNDRTEETFKTERSQL